MEQDVQGRGGCGYLAFRAYLAFCTSVLRPNSHTMLVIGWKKVSGRSGKSTNSALRQCAAARIERQAHKRRLSAAAH